MASYKKWEDYNNGLFYDSCSDYEYKKNESIAILSSEDDFYNTACRLFVDWPICTEVNLTNVGHNRLAWIGQASCCFNHQAPDFVTIDAWREMSESLRRNANSTAENVLQDWLKRNTQDCEALCLKLE